MVALKKTRTKKIRPLKDSQKAILEAFAVRGGINLALDEVDTHPGLAGISHQALGGVLGSLKRRQFLISRKGKERVDYFDLTDAGQAALNAWHAAKAGITTKAN